MQSTAVLVLQQKLKFVIPSEGLSIPIMTPYELNSVISLRAVHLSSGTIPLIDIPASHQIQSNMELRKIAFEELKQNKLPYAIERKFPNGSIEIWRVSDLKLAAVEYIIEAALTK